MKKNIISVFLVGFMIMASVGSAQAATPEDLLSGMGKKLIRGVVNTFTGWIEIPAQIAKGYDRGFGQDKDNKFWGATVGIFTGIWHGTGRTISGLGEIAGFWAADPKDNNGIGIPLDAEYAWECGTAYNLSDPTVTDATLVPMGHKLLRGLGNGLFGFVEFPGQILKGIRHGAPDLGIIKGLWYWYSREIDGIYDLSSFILPNPKDTKALPFDEKWAWSAFGDNMK